MFDQFAGEFLAHPAMLDYSGNTCSHQCSYCFANLNEPVRDAHFKQALNFIDNIHTRSSVTQILADEGFPICISNRSDPLSNSNWAQTVPIIEKLRTRKNGLFFQTKGGTQERMDKFIELIKPIKDRVIVYVTYTSNKKSISKRVEPNAPSPRERLEFIKDMIGEGIAVSVGLNPLLEAWLPLTDAVETALNLHALGVKYFWLQSLYLRERWIRRFNEARLEALHDVNFTDVMKRRVGLTRAEEYASIVAELIIRGGAPVKTPGMPWTTGIGKLYREKFKIHSPVWYDFFDVVNPAPDDATFTFEDFLSACSGGSEAQRRALEKNVQRSLSPFIFRISKRGWLNVDVRDQTPFTMAGLLRTIWKSPFFKESPQRAKGYLKVVDHDKEGLPILGKDLTGGFFEWNAEVTQRINT